MNLSCMLMIATNTDQVIQKGVYCTCASMLQRKAACFGFPSAISRIENQTVLLEQNWGPKRFFHQRKSADHVCGHYALSECTAGLFMNLFLTKLDLWEWCCTRRGFSLFSMRFSTFFRPR